MDPFSLWQNSKKCQVNIKKINKKIFILYFFSALIKSDSELDLFISQEYINDVKSIEELKEIVINKLQKF